MTTRSTRGARSASPALTARAVTAWAVMAWAVMAAMAGPALAGGRVLAKVDGDEITEDDVRAALSDIGPTIPPMTPAAREAYVVDYLIEIKLVAHKAARDKLGQGADFVRRMAYYHDKLLMQSMLSGTAKAAATEDALRQRYETASAAQQRKEEIHARHILLPTQAAAQEALKRIEAGEDFAKVATELSKDPGGAGGDLGWFTKDRMVPEFAEAAFRIPAGELSQPVRTQFGWHIIKVEERRLQPFPTFDQVKDQIGRFVVQRAREALIQELRSDAKIDRLDSEGRTIAAVPTPPSEAANMSAQGPALGKHNRIESIPKP